VKKLKNRKYDDAVSPVVGVMLMLVVCIIIAAVVSAFAGSLASANAEKTPTLAMDVRIVNSGTYVGSGFFATVTGASEAVPTKDLQLVTSWATTDRKTGEPLRRSTTVNPGDHVFTSQVGMSAGTRIGNATPPWGYGAGVTGGQNPTNPYGDAYYGTQFGNYTFVPGTSMSAWPAPYRGGQNIGGNVQDVQAGTLIDYDGDGGYIGGIDGKEMYVYYDGAMRAASDVDAMEAVLGKGWENLKLGDRVLVALVHTPSGKTVFTKTVSVEA
jgi:FlaG/FlaF family flagellin (archaellin)